MFIKVEAQLVKLEAHILLVKKSLFHFDYRKFCIPASFHFHTIYTLSTLSLYYIQEIQNLVQPHDLGQGGQPDRRLAAAAPHVQQDSEERSDE